MTIPSYIRLPGRGVLRLSGDDARSFLQGLITNDVDRVTAAHAIYAALLTPQGKYLHDFFVAEHDGEILLDCAAARLPDLMKRLGMYRLRAQVEIEDISEGWDVIALRGAAGDRVGSGERGAAEPCLGGIAFVDPRHAALGQRAIVPTDGLDEALAKAGFQEETWEGLEDIRVSLGVPDAAADLIPEKSMPLECGFDELDAVSFEKGCFVGQEVTVRMKHRGLVKKRLVPVTFDGDPPAPGTPVKYGDVEIGEIRSAAGGRAIALIRLDRLDAETLSADETHLSPEKPDWMAF